MPGGVIAQIPYFRALPIPDLLFRWSSISLLMALLTSVLVRGINNLSDARYCAGMGADGLIFTLDPTLPGAVDAATVKELAGWVAGVELIGEFGDEIPISEINRLVEECGLQRVLLRQRPEEPLSVPALLHAPLFLITSNSLRNEMLLQYQPVFSAGLGVVAALDLDDLPEARQEALAEAATQLPVWLSGTITADNVAGLLSAIQPAGLILEGGNEIKPGLRDFEELEAVFEALEAE
jgi:phosphoribosylanthranilate isomerase